MRRSTGGIDDDLIQEACAIAWLALIRRTDIELDGRGYSWLLVTATREARRAYRDARDLQTDPAPDAAADIDELEARSHTITTRSNAHWTPSCTKLAASASARSSHANSATCCSRPPATSIPRSPTYLGVTMSSLPIRGRMSSATCRRPTPG
jgi:hypothetical protein